MAHLSPSSQGRGASVPWLQTSSTAHSIHMQTWFCIRSACMVGSAIAPPLLEPSLPVNPKLADLSPPRAKREARVITHALRRN